MRTIRSSTGRLLAAATVLAVLAGLTPSAAAPLRGFPDRRFGSAGSVRTNIGGWDVATAVAVQRDGKVVVAGYTGFGDGLVGVVRYLRNGRLDRSFSRDGTVVTRVEELATVSGVAIAPDGDIVVAGTHSRYGEACCEYDAYLLRYRRNGTLDRSFGDGGKLILEAPGGRALNTLASGIAILPDGSVIVGGTLFTQHGQDDLEEIARERIPSSVEVPTSAATIWLAKVDPAGAFDPAFGLTGHAVLSADGAENALYDLTALADGSIVLAGQTEGDPKPGLLVAKLLPTGALDPTFGTAGSVVVRGAGDFETVGTGIEIVRGGKVMAVGYGTAGRSYTFPDQRITLVRLHPDGSFDASFDRDGIKRFKNGVSSRAWDTATTARGTTYVLGSYSCATFYCGDRPTVMAITARGAMVKRFGYGGLGSLPADLFSATAITLHQGRPLVVGSAHGGDRSQQICSGSTCFFFGIPEFDFMAARLRG